jgi:hypothetical protein
LMKTAFDQNDVWPNVIIGISTKHCFDQKAFDQLTLFQYFINLKKFLRKVKINIQLITMLVKMIYI